MSRPVLPWLVAAAALALAAVEAGRSLLPTAHAQDVDGTTLLCRTFKQPLDEGPPLETSDRTSEVGRWIAEQRPRGWQLRELDWEIASKPSGYPQAYVYVCLAR
jgi:hypothetical protein